MKILKFVPAFFLFLFSGKLVSAHCPLCTVGVVAAAGGATWLGVNSAAIGVFVGAFSISIAWWIGRLLVKKFNWQKKSALIITVLAILSFFTTVIPIMALIPDFFPVYISIGNNYGSLLNRTYLVNQLLFGSIIGAIITSITPFLSKLISKFRNDRLFPYQGVILTFILLIIAGVILQFVM